MLTRPRPAFFLGAFLLGGPARVVAGQPADPDAARDRGWRVELAGYLQGDLRSYRGWTVGDGASAALRAPESEWRRLRVGVNGRYRKLRFELDVAPAFDRGDELKDAWLGLRLARALELRLGHQKLPVSPERLVSAARTDFIDRAVAVDTLAPARDWGIQLLGEHGRLEYQSGVFAGDGSRQRGRASTTVAGRLVVKPARWLSLGGSASRGDVRAATAGPDFAPDPAGFRATTATGYALFPPLFVQGRRQRAGLDAVLHHGPVAVRGEYLEAREQRSGQGPVADDLPDTRGRGWAASATWLVTGEKKSRRIRPRRALPAGPGAVELTLRHETLRVDDLSNSGFEAAGDRARNVRPAGLRVTTGGINWWPVAIVRLTGNLLVEEYTDLLRAPEPGRRRYVSLLGRAQLSLP